MSESSPVLEVDDLHKTYTVGFWRRKVDAVRGVSFRVEAGEIFGLLGPNGAGKTTTIKTILRLIFPTRGNVRIFGRPSHEREATRRVGYMPENPYVYQYLRPYEFLDLCGRLMGMEEAERTRRAKEIVERVGLGHAIERPVGKFSKGMMQRIGLAQALLHDPEFLVLDEPMSGLDPMGRKEIRDILVEQRKRGKTLLFTSHILSDVERLCDRVAIVHRGKITAHGRLDELLRAEIRNVEIELGNVSEELALELGKRDIPTHRHGAKHTVVLQGDARVNEVLDLALKNAAAVVSVTPQRETLEDLFVRGAVKSGD